MGAGIDWFQVAELWPERFFCVMPDLPGHGHNTRFPLSRPLSFDVVVADLELFLEQIELDQVGLIGYSMGGRIALYAALKFPEKIKALVLESASPGLADEQARRERAELDDKRAETLLAVGIDAFVEQWYELGLFRTLKRQLLLFEETKQKRKKMTPAGQPRSSAN
jgi:2-succinyl-6-hydroxy-2,4-cyclohexadiene-1-carboxylate synthase